MLPIRFTSWIVLFALASFAVFMPACFNASRVDGDDRDRSFELNVRPLLVEHCIQCHGSEKQEGGLRLDNREQFARGGETGRVVDSADFENSLLIKAVRYLGPEMPPSKKLSDESIGQIEAWVRSGANWPEYVEPLTRTSTSDRFTSDDRNYWLFLPLRQVPVSEADRTANPIDVFVQAKLEPLGLRISEPASDSILMRRAYLDLVGVPPTWDELQAYLADTAIDRYSRLISKLMDDTRYGERWAQHWLDLVRYADSDGFKQDSFRPTAYRYRDYVIQSWNEDKPYAQFITEQIAGDELDPDSDAMNAATGYLRHWMYEYNQRDVASQWDNILNDLTDVTGEVFLGLGFSCARCHDHKFDPILQKDYYRLQAFFSAIEPRYDIPASKVEFAKWEVRHERWLEKSRQVTEQMDALESPIRKSTTEATIDKFPPDIRPALRKTRQEQNPLERQLTVLASLQVQNELNTLDFSKRLKDQELEEWKRLKRELDELSKSAPSSYAVALTIRDVGPSAPNTSIPGRLNDQNIRPGFLSVLNPSDIEVEPIGDRSTGRRLALARWIADPDNPMAWRTIVNRVWQRHFHRGIAVNSSDLGRLSEPPTDPELLDWLAQWFVDHNGRFKQLHYLLMTSRAYQQSSYPQQRGSGVVLDFDNRFIWRHTPHRMDGEQIRDTLLQVSGELDKQCGGPAALDDSKRRSVYLRKMRNAPNPMLAAFDAPDGNASVAKRNNTTTSLQALYLTNDPWPMQRASKIAEGLFAGSKVPEDCIVQAYHRILLREPTENELSQGVQYVCAEDNIDSADISSTDSNAAVRLELLIDFCHAMFGSNEFLYVE